MRRVFLCFIFFPLWVSSIESYEAFQLSFMDKELRLLSPREETQVFALSVKNETSMLLRGKVHTEKSNVMFFSIPAGESRTIELDHLKGERVWVTALSPSYQSVELKFQQGPHAVSPKK